MKKAIITTTALFLSGLTAGTFFYGTFCVLPTFYKVPYHIQISFRTVLMSYNKFTVMALVIAALISSLVYFWQVRNNKAARILSATAIFLMIIILLITRLGSVPINMEMKNWDTFNPPAVYKVKMQTWDLYNAIRTVAALVSFLCLLVTDLSGKKAKAD
jgi:uncharacterized membrane protein